MQEYILNDFLVLNLVLAILLLPIISFVTLFLGAKLLPRRGDWLATGFIGLNFILSLLLFLFLRYTAHEQSEYLIVMDWFKLGKYQFNISFLVNNISVLMLLVVNFISFLVNLYSIEYMRGKRNYERYFPYLSIFTFAMIGIVLSHNLLITFMFWELVGFSSYLLIGFWFDKTSAVKASKKAFLFNRIGDIGFLIALLLVYTHLHTFELSAIESYFKLNYPSVQFPLWVSLAGLGFFAACVGKSAQFPLQVWLPDAMEGPTPVSALIHAATMVAAGVYLLVKIFFLLSPEVKVFIAFTGATTALIGAVPALFQNDIKKVLAYSTISQLGYMVMGMGFDSYAPSFFHLLTHAFFKACLFLSAGAVIHAMHEIKHKLALIGEYRDFDAQDMRLMGGFYKKMPIAFIAFLASSLALVGIPFFSGALSKEILLDQSWLWAQRNAADGKFVFYLIPILAYTTLLITSMYVARQLYLVFFGTFRLAEIHDKAKVLFDHLKENHWLINIPLLLLTLLSFWWIFSLNPLDAYQGWLLQSMGVGHQNFHFNPLPFVIIAVGLAIAFWRKKDLMLSLNFFKQYGHSNTNVFLKAIRNDWNMDAVYYHTLVRGGLGFSYLVAKVDAKLIDPFIHAIAVANVVLGHITAWLDKHIIDGILHLILKIVAKIGDFTRSFQSGKIQNYMAFVFFVVLLLLIWVAFI